jgi:hypothetical protein
MMSRSPGKRRKLRTSAFRSRTHNSSTLSKKDLELLNQAGDKSRKLMKRWDERLTLGNLKFPQRFEAGDLRFLLPFGDIHSGKRGIVVFEPVVAVETLTFTENVTADSYQSSVFVDVIRFVKSPKRVIPAFVRLEPVDELHSSWFNESLYFSTSKGFLSMKVFANRERNVSQILPARLRTTYQCQLIDHVVESTPKVLQDIASRGEHVETDDREFSEVRQALGSFRILIADTNVSVGVPIGLRCRFEFGEVLFGPFDFYPDEDKSFFGAQRHKEP